MNELHRLMLLNHPDSTQTDLEYFMEVGTTLHDGEMLEDLGITLEHPLIGKTGDLPVLPILLTLSECS